MAANSGAVRHTEGRWSEFLQGYSVELTSGDRKSQEAAVAMLPRGTQVFIASVPKDTTEQRVQVAATLRRAGLAPVPHLVARTLKSVAELDSMVQRFASEAEVDSALVLAGDRDQPAGDLHSSLQLIESGVLQRHGIRRIFIGAYPEGHPRIAEEELVTARAAKLAAAGRAGVEVTLVTQFCFDSQPILEMAAKLRSDGVTAPLRVGVAGPTSRTTLLKYALLCGVGPSIRALKNNQSLAKNILAGESPEELLTDVARARANDASLGLEGVHFFTFGSLAATIQWVEGQLRAGHGAA